MTIRELKKRSKLSAAMKSCIYKRRIESEVEAMSLLSKWEGQIYNITGDQILNVYICSQCGFMHLGKTKVKMKAARAGA